MNGRRYIKKIIKNGYKFVYNYNTLPMSKYPYMIHIYNPKGSRVYYELIKSNQDLKWTYEYMDKWFENWLKENHYE